MKISTVPYYLFIAAIFMLLVSPDLFSDGMFMDGLLYAIISQNLANGIGSFWDLQLTQTLYLHFHEHPPLAFGIQSIFFKLFGNSILVERFYSIITFLITAWLMIKIWVKIVEPKHLVLSWIPLFFFIAIPAVSWSASNNMLENTMMVFTTSSFLFLIKALQSEHKISIVLAGLSLFLAFLTKGLVALYLFSFFFWMLLFFKTYKIKAFFTDTLIFVISFLSPFLLLYFFVPEGIDSLMDYFTKQIVGSLENVVTVESRFFIIKRLLSELIPSFIIVSLVLFFTRKYKSHQDYSKWIFLFLSIGLSGVLPIMVSLKQSGFYILTTYPFFSLLFALLITPSFYKVISKINVNSRKYKIFKYITYVIFVGSLVFANFQIKKTSRDQEMLEDIYTMSYYVPSHSIISIEKELFSNWSLHGYFYRNKQISLDDNSLNHKFLILRKGSSPQYLRNYEKVGVNLNSFDFYKRKGIKEKL